MGLAGPKRRKEVNKPDLRGVDDSYQEEPPADEQSAGGDGGGSDFGERLARVEARMDALATKEDLAEIKTNQSHLATKEDIQKLKVWVLGGVLSGFFLAAAIAARMLK